MQDSYGRTSLHVAATWGCVRTCDGIVEASREGINRVDIFGQTALDCAREKKQDATVAIILSKGGLSGNHPSLQHEHEDTLTFFANNRIDEKNKRKQRVLQQLPEFKTRVTISAIQAALQSFMEVRFE